MDPTACVKRLLDAWKDDEFDEVCYACVDLASWLDGGGCVPTMTSDMWKDVLAIIMEAP